MGWAEKSKTAPRNFNFTIFLRIKAIHFSWILRSKSFLWPFLLLILKLMTGVDLGSLKRSRTTIYFFLTLIYIISFRRSARLPWNLKMNNGKPQGLEKKLWVMHIQGHCSLICMNSDPNLVRKCMKFREGKLSVKIDYLSSLATMNLIARVATIRLNSA